MANFPFPKDTAKHAGVADLTHQFVDQMGEVYRHMDVDLEHMGPFELSALELNDATKMAEFDAAVGMKVASSGNYPSFMALLDLVNHERFHGLVRIAKFAGHMACEDEKEATLEWAAGATTSLVGLHINYVAPLINKFSAAPDVPRPQVELLGKLQRLMVVEQGMEDVHTRHFVQSDGGITDANDERLGLADMVKSGAWFDGAPSLKWPLHMLIVVGRLRESASFVEPPTEKMPETLGATQIIDRPVTPFKKLPKDASELHDLLGALVKGDSVVVSNGTGRTEIKLPAVPNAVAKHIVSIVASYRGELDNLVSRVREVATEQPEMANGDETSQALAYLGANLETLRIVSNGGRGSLRLWARAVR